MKRTFVTFAVAAAVVAAAQPATARRPSAPVLRATTTIAAATSGWVDVVVPRAARLSPSVDANPDVRFSGAGRFLAFWLVRHDENQQAWNGVYAYRLPAFAGGGTAVYGSVTPGPTCTNFPNDQLPLHTECRQAAPEAILLPAGRYRLTVVTDGAPVTVRLRLRGLDGRGAATIRPSRNLATAQQALPQRETAGDRLVTFGGVMNVAAPSDVYVVARAEAPAGGAVREESLCERPPADAARPWAFAPPCPAGHSGSYRAWANAAGQERFLWGGYVSTTGADARSFAIGGSFGDSGGVRFVAALAIAVAS